MTTLLAGTSAFDYQQHLVEERLRILNLLTALVVHQRSRGRSPAADAVNGMVIEDGEAEGLVRELEISWRSDWETSDNRPAFAEQRNRIARRADEASASGVPLPLWRARKMFALTAAEYDALLLALLVECDARVGRLAAYLNDHVGQSRPTVGLVHALAELQGIACEPLRWIERPVLADGLLTLDGSGPLPSRTVRLDHVQARRVTSLDTSPEPRLSAFPPDIALLDRLVLPDETRTRILSWAGEVDTGRGTPVVVITGPEGSGRTTLARAGAGAAGRSLVEAAAALEDPWPALRMLRREARWYGGAAMTVRLEAGGAGGEEFWQALGTPPGLLFIDVPEPLLAGVLATAPAEPMLWRCVIPGTSGRTELWQRQLPTDARLTDRDAEVLAAAFRFGPASVSRAVRRADAGRGQAPLDRAALAAAAREQVGDALRRLADRLPLPYRREDLVLRIETDREIDLALTWMRHGARSWTAGGSDAGWPRVADEPCCSPARPGPARRWPPRCVADELELDCTGSTSRASSTSTSARPRRTCRRVFDEAEAGGAVLFFDEADALFGKRTEVRDAHDRYANLEVGYLLQRMEHVRRRDDPRDQP